MNHTFYSNNDWWDYLAHSRSHKYVAKVKGAGKNGKTLYFYTQEAYQGFLKGQQRRKQAVDDLDVDIADHKDAVKDDMGYVNLTLLGRKNPNETQSRSEVIGGQFENAFYNMRQAKLKELKKKRLKKKYKVTRSGANTLVSDTGTGGATHKKKKARQEQLRRARAMEAARR